MTTTKRGFTLIELLVVISIIGLLSSIVLASLQTSRDKAINSKKLAGVKEYAKALELYFSVNNAYPLASLPTRKRCIFNVTCLSGSADSNIYTALAPFITPSTTFDPVIISGIDYGGLGYKCLTQNADGLHCDVYVMFWVMKGVSNSCAGGFSDQTTNPIDTDAPQQTAVPSTNTVCIYTNDKGTYDATVAYQ